MKIAEIRTEWLCGKRILTSHGKNEKSQYLEFCIKDDKTLESHAKQGIKSQSNDNEPI